MVVSEKPVKQVIVIRKDLNMRRGKECAQASHASNGCIERLLLDYARGNRTGLLPVTVGLWLATGRTKVVCQVPDESTLLELYSNARLLELETHLIQDEGRTEFGGVRTYTALAIGPDFTDKIDMVTRDLKLY